MPAVDLLSLDAPSQSVPSHPPTSSNAPSDLLSDLDGLPPRAHLQPPSHVPPQPSPSSAPPASAVSSHTPTHPPLASSSGPSPRGDSLGDLLGGPALEDPFAVAAPLGQGGSVPGEAPMVARKAAGVVGRGGAPMKGGVGAGNGNGVRGSQKKDPFADLLG